MSQNFGDKSSEPNLRNRNKNAPKNQRNQTSKPDLSESEIRGKHQKLKIQSKSLQSKSQENSKKNQNHTELKQRKREENTKNSKRNAYISRFCCVIVESDGNAELLGSEIRREDSFSSVANSFPPTVLILFRYENRISCFKAHFLRSISFVV